MVLNPHNEFLQAYQPIHSRFVKYCSSMAYGQMETQDLVQETILLTMQKWEEIRKKESLLAFMVGVAGRKLKAQARKSQRESRFEMEKESLRKMESKTQNPELAFDIHLLFKAMENLSEKEKECLVLFEISGFCIREVAEIQNESETAIKSRLSRSRQKLRQLLEDGMTSQIAKPARTQTTLFNFLMFL